MNNYSALLEKTFGFAKDYVEGIDKHRVYPTEETIKKLEAFDSPLPKEGTDAEEVMELLGGLGNEAASAITGGRYFGFVTGNILPIANAAAWMTDVWNQNGCLYAMSPLASKLEDVAEKWLVDLFKLEKGTAMGAVTGSQNALICGFLAARQELLRRQGWDIEKQGVRNAPRFRVVLGEGAHSSVLLALKFLGVGSDEIERVPIDNEGRMRPECVPQLDSNTLFILQAGNVNGGSYDDIDRLCDIGNKAGAWVHIDGAFGLWARVSKKYGHFMKGLEKADSCSCDAHKTLNAGYDCGLIFCKERKALSSAMQAGGAYLVYSDNRDGSSYVTEMSRRARGIVLWAIIKQLGADGVEAMIDKMYDNTQYFAEELKKAGYELVIPAFENQFMVALDTEEKTKAALKVIQDSGECWCGSSIWEGRFIIRVSVCSYATTTEDIDRSVAVFKRALEAAK